LVIITKCGQKNFPINTKLLSVDGYSYLLLVLGVHGLRETVITNQVTKLFEPKGNARTL